MGGHCAVRSEPPYPPAQAGRTSRSLPDGPGTMPQALVPGELSWLMEDLTSRVDHVRQAAVLSADGLPLGSSHGLSQADAEHLAALAAGVQSLARGAGAQFEGGGIRQTVIEMDTAFLFIASAGYGTCLAVLTDQKADAGAVAYEMTVLLKRIGQHLAAKPR